MNRMDYVMLSISLICQLIYCTVTIFTATVYSNKCNSFESQNEETKLEIRVLKMSLIFRNCISYDHI